MPCLNIFTNLPKSKIPSGFVNNILPILSRTVKKPVEQFICVVNTDCLLSFGSDNSPGVVGSLESIGHLGVQENKVITAEVTKFIADQLQVNKDMIFISYYDVQGQNIGKGGLTFG